MTTLKLNYIRPRIDAFAKDFWDGLKNRKLLAQKCKKCREVFFPPRPRCPECLSNEVEWAELSGMGELYSWTEVHTPSPIFDTPYVIGIVNLEEGVGRVITKLDAKPEDLEMGMKVKIDYLNVTDALTLYIFRPIKQSK